MFAHWQLQLGWFSVLVALVALAAGGWVAYRHWRHGTLGRRVWLQEGLRLLAIGLLALTLLRPERVGEVARTRQPQLAVVLDDTGSMATRDVVLPASGAETEPTVITRQVWVERQKAAAPWHALEGTYEVNVESLRGLTGPDSPGTDLNGGLQHLLDKYPRLRAVLLLSDGDWNTGGPPDAAATQLRLKGVPVYGVAVGSDSPLPDVAIEDVKAPAFGLPQERLSIPFRVRNDLPDELRTSVNLMNGQTVLARQEVVVAPGQTLEDSIMWTATDVGEFQLTMAVAPQPGEVNLENNKRDFRIAIRQELLKVLVVETLPRWEFRYLRNALMRDPGVEVSCLLLHPQLGPARGAHYIQEFPTTREAIAGYDVIFLGDVGEGTGGLTHDQLDLIKGVVEQQGSGLVFLPGRQGKESSLLKGPLADLIPVTLDPNQPQGISASKESRLTLTSSGEDHLLTMLANGPVANRSLWQRLPGFYWSAAVIKAKPGAEVLAVHDTLRNDFGRVPLLVARPQGSGNVLFMGTDAAWRWRRGVEDTYHYRFWGQVVRWMAHPRHLAQSEHARLVFVPENPRRGDSVFLQATVLDGTGFPLREGPVSVDVRAPGQAERLALSPMPGGWGVFTGRFVAQKEGQYDLTVNAPDGRSLTTKLVVAPRDLEVIGAPARSAVLKELTQLTQGRFGRLDELPALLAQLKLLPETDHLEVRFRPWSTWWWGLSIVGVLAVMWVLRKLWGLM